MSKVTCVIARWIGRIRFSRDSDTPIEIEADYDAVLQLVRKRASSYMAGWSEIAPDDRLVRHDRFGRDDISYFATNLEDALNLKISDADWAKVYTFDDLVRLLVKYLHERQIKTVSR